ncbi:MAG: condensation domain-containing protein, partial [Flammeovirgaceae bacterium]
DLHDLIGFLANTIVYRTNIHPEGTFMELLAAVKHDATNSYNHQMYPFDVLVEKLELSRDLSQSPLFNVMVAHNNTEVREPQNLAEVNSQTATLDEDFSIAKFDLVFFLDHTGDYVYGELEYNSDLFKRDTAQRIVSNFLALIESVTEAPGKPIYALNAISADEKKLIGNFSMPTATRPAFQPIHAYVETQAVNAPNAIAIRSGENVVTYQA